MTKVTNALYIMSQIELVAMHTKCCLYQEINIYFSVKISFNPISGLRRSAWRRFLHYISSFGHVFIASLILF